MALHIKLDAFLNTKPQPEWLNQLRVTIAVGKKFEQKGDYEKAAKCYETVLYYDPVDTRTRVKLSKCYQKLLQPEQAAQHQTHAMQNDPDLLQTIENEACVNFKLGNFESSLMTYGRYFMQRKTSFDCNQGLLKINEVMDNYLPANGIMSCLKDTMLQMIENEQFFDLDTCEKLNDPKKFNTIHKTHNEQTQEAYYLRNMVQNVRFYRKQLDVLPKYNKHDKLVYEQIQKVVHTFETAKKHLYQKKPFYMYACQRPNRQLNDQRKIKDMVILQFSKYINSIVEHCLSGKIESARRQAELAMEYMDEHRYRPLKVVNTLYEVFGLALYLLNRDIPEWSNEMNDKRILFILGSSFDKKDAYNHVYHESYFGPKNQNTKSYLKKLSRQLNGIELTTYRLYLQYERIKCYMHLNDFKATRPLTKKMFNDACALGSIAWQVNALMLTMISESKLGNGLQCIKTIEFIISLSRTLGDENVTAFMRKMWKLFATDQVQVPEISTEDERKADLIKIMPDSENILLMDNLLNRIDRLPKECRMSLMLGEPPQMNCADHRAYIRQEPLIVKKRWK
ncbi:outer dynein arm-docking complex subunit 4-like [Rhopalosiphum padi]|uniref:outer dynein arm-docking complex subunit 4-like n=1 Tax=Rhopalosiphum padi TaxID=40932 RepID=UPI00298E41BB|nr:outer dynein arm-docking complex subunit 4-like [Rhopalosiphum padi]